MRSFDIQQWHAARLADLRREWPRDVALAGLPVQAFPADRAIAALPGGGFRNAALAMPVAMSKALVERPAVQAVVPQPPELGALEGNVPWATLGKVHADASKLDEAAIAAVAAKHPRAWADASDLGRPLTGAEVSALVTSFEGTMAADTARNAYFHHALIHEWLATAPASFESLNARIYAEIFRTPANDPWLGLVSPGAYSAIQDDGIVKR